MAKFCKVLAEFLAGFALHPEAQGHLHFHFDRRPPASHARDARLDNTLVGQRPTFQRPLTAGDLSWHTECVHHA